MTHYNKRGTNGQSTIVNIFFRLELAKRAAPKKILACFVHPGGIYDTGMTTHLKEKEFKGPKEVSTANMGKSFDVDPPKTLSWGTAPILVASLNPGL